MAATHQGALTVGGAGVSFVPPASFTAWDMLGTSIPTDPATGSFTIHADGTCSGFGLDAQGGTIGSPNWAVPTNAANGNGLWVLFSVTAGTATTNTASGWVALTSDQTIEKQSATGTSSCTFTISIATDSLGSNVVWTKAGNIVRYAH